MEGDIKILEELIEKYRNGNVNMLDLDANKLFKRLILEEDQVQLIENLIKGYKIEKLRNTLDEQSLKEALDDYIPKSKAKEKIEEINQEKLNYSEDEWYLESEIKAYAIEKLQELMED